MELNCIELTAADIDRLKPLHTAYKLEIGEDAPTDADYDRLAEAMRAGKIRFFGCEVDGRLTGCCSVAPGWSTFNYAPSGVFEDFYILPEYRHRGVARQLVRYAAAQSGVGSLTVPDAVCGINSGRADQPRVFLTVEDGTLYATIAPSGTTIVIR